MPDITRFSLDNTRLTALFLAAIVLAGVFIFLNYPSREDPSIVIRNAQVTAVFPGMAPGRVEDLLTRPIEEKVREIPEVEHILSDSKTGVALVKIELHDEVTDLDAVWQTLRDKMADIASDLPDGTRGPTVDDEIGLTAVATIAMTSDGFSLAEMHDMTKTVRDRLYPLAGIKKIELYGVQEERIYLEVARAKIVQYGIQPQQIVDTLQRQNIILPGGRIDAAGKSIVLEPSGNFRSLDEIGRVLIAAPDSDRVAELRDLATLSRGTVDPPERPVRFNGRPAIILSVSILDGVNSIQFGERLDAALADIEAALPWGIMLDYATFQPELVARAVDGAVGNLYQTLVIVLVVVIVFLGLRTGLIVGAFVPFAMLLGIVVMSLFEVELQRVSIAAMVIALGMLVDNGIVMAEDIRVRHEAGASLRQAALDAGRTLAVPLLTSSLTTILFFLPMAMAVGSTGEYTESLAQVITIVLLGSWFLAMYATPAMCTWFMKPVSSPTGAAADRTNQGLYRVYRSVLAGLLKARLPFLGAMLALLVGAGLLLQWVPKEFFPLGDRNQFLVYVDLPAGSSVTETEDSVARLSAWLADSAVNPEVTGTVGYVGSGGPRFFLSLSPLDPDPHKAFLLVTTRTAADVPALVARTRAHLLDQFPEARGEVKEMWLGGSEAGLVEIRLIGPDIGALRAGGEALVAALAAISGTLGAKQDWENRILKIDVVVDQARARGAGITSEQLANALNAYLSGIEVTDYREGETTIPIVLRGVAAERGTLEGLLALSVYSSEHQTAIPLGQIARLVPHWEDARIKRRDQERTLTVSAKHETLGGQALLDRLRPAIDALDLPPGHRIEIGGEAEKQAEAQRNLFENLPLAVAGIVILLVWQFRSYRRTAIILLTIPLVLVGATGGLFLFQAKFGFMVILGLFSLAGIIINNAIVLIDRIEEERGQGSPVDKAVVDAAAARFRPILITTLTTVLGLVPLIWSHDPLFYAMAAAMAVGLAVGTVLTLGVVPVLYSLFFGFRRA